MFNRRPPPLDYAAPVVRRRPRLDFSLNGLIFCCIMLFMGLAAINSGANLLYGMFGLMIGLLLVAGVVSRKVLKKLAAHRTLPDHATVGVATTIAYRFENRKRFWPSLSVTVAELDGADGFVAQPQGYLLHAAAGGIGTEVATEVVPLRRGLHYFDQFQLVTGFPFGFIKRAASQRQADKLLAYPACGTVDRALLRLCRTAEHTGAAMRPEPGGQDEFYGVKEHRPGESPRHIHWRRSARSIAAGRPLVAREMTRAAPPRVLVLVDTFLADRSAAEFARVERAIAMAASVVSAALEDELSVGLLAWLDGWQRIEPSRGKRHQSDLLSALAKLPMNAAKNTDRLIDQGLRHTRNGTTAVLFTPRPRPAGLDPRYRGALVVVPAGSAEAAAWVRWDPPIDFAACVPADQVGEVDGGR
jgi:uncharacterized protein (DUF58 family)